MCHWSVNLSMFTSMFTSRNLGICMFLFCFVCLFVVVVVVVVVVLGGGGQQENCY